MFEDFFESPSPAIYAKMLINTENPDKNKEFVGEIKDRISDLKDRIREMGEKEKKKKKNADVTLKIIEKFFDYNKNAQKKLHIKLASKVD